MEDEATSSLLKAAKTNSPGRLETSDTRGTEVRGEDASAPKARVAINATPKPNAVVVNAKQKGNPLLRYITNIPWEYGEIVPDYVTGRGTCVLFLSLRYHRLNPDYIHDRLKLLGKSYDLRVLLVQVDLAEPQHALKHLTRICILADLTLMLAWNAEEAGKIIETYKIYENKPPEMIMERGDASPHQKITNALTTVRSVNKTDAMTLLTTFGSVKGIVKASSDALSLCPGFGTHKAIRLRKTLHEPFLRNSTRKSAEVERPN